MTAAKNLTSSLKAQLEKVSTRVVDLEKRAEKEIRSVLKKTDHTRRQQMKRVNELLSEAQKFGSSGVLCQAGKLQKDLEKMAGQRVQILMKKLQLPSQNEIDRLQSKIADLEARVKRAESRPVSRRKRTSPSGSK